MSQSAPKSDIPLSPSSPYPPSQMRVNGSMTPNRRILRSGKRFWWIAVQRRSLSPRPLHCNPSTSFRPAQIFVPPQLVGRKEETTKEANDTKNKTRSLSVFLGTHSFAPAAIRVYLNSFSLCSVCPLWLILVEGPNVRPQRTQKSTKKKGGGRQLRPARFLCAFAALRDAFVLIWLRPTAAPRSLRPLRFILSTHLCLSVSICG